MTLTGPADPKREEERWGSVRGAGDKNREGRKRKRWAGLLAKACGASVN